jgi:hypothetical protein
MWYLADTAAVFGDETALLPDEHLRTRTEVRLRASTSGYGEVRVGVAYGC